MKTFGCHCGNTLYFENSICLSCGRTTGFLPELMRMAGLDAAGEERWREPGGALTWRRCRNYRELDVCNWMVAADDPDEYCRSCRLDVVIPNLDRPRNLTLWYRIEAAKRRLLYTLFRLQLPVIGRAQDPERGLGFEFLSDDDDGAAYDSHAPQSNIVTGHRAGIITINIREAEDHAREEIREQMNERYRTLLGHFRHEVGHYYWDRMLAGSARLDAFRALFGDERDDYARALEAYYRDGPPVGWEETWITAYASAHPWEDWAETWAHYLHMVDTLETAHDHGFSIDGRRLATVPAGTQAASGYAPMVSFDDLINDWTALTIALNALNRSMGLPDAYPFALSNKTLEKLAFTHTLVTTR